MVVSVIDVFCSVKLQMLTFLSEYLNRAVMDTSEKGDLESCTLLTEFSVNPRSFSTFPDDQPFTYSFNVHDDGNILEIVTCICK